MRKSFLFKAACLVVALAAVTTVIVSVRGNGLGAGSMGGQRQTFFAQFVVAGGPIVWFVLLPMSLVTVYLAVAHCLTIRRAKLLPEGGGGRIAETVRRFGAEQLGGQISERSDFVTRAVVSAINRGRGDWFRMRNALFESLEEQALVFIHKIEWISLIGNVSPMVGLFGTVFGMIKLFNAIVTAGGQPQPAQLAEGISIALVTTFWGLLIAIPALTVHGVFRNRIETILSEAVAEAENILPEITYGFPKQDRTGQAKPKQSIRELPAKSAGKVRQSTLS